MEPTALLNQRIAEAATWCEARGSVKDLARTCRSANLEPEAIMNVDAPYRRQIVEELCTRRAGLLVAEGWAPRAAADRTSGKLLVFDPDQSLSDGAARVASEGFFDSDNVPAWDTWVMYVEEPRQDPERWTALDSYLLCWIPGPLIAIVQRAIDVNPEQCLQWAEGVRAPFVLELRTAGLIR